MPPRSAGWPEPCRRNLVVLLPGSRWKTKKFPPALFAEVIRRVHAEKPECVFAVLGASSDREEQEMIRQEVGPGFPAPRAGGQDFARRHDGSAPQRPARSQQRFRADARGGGAQQTGVRLFRPHRSGQDRSVRENTPHLPASPGCLNCLRRSCPKGELSCHRLDAVQIANDCIQILTTGD